MIKRFLDRAFFIISEFFDKFGYTSNPEITSIFAITFFLSLFTIPYLSKDYFMIEYASFAIGCLLLLYFRFIHNGKYISLIERQEEVKWYEKVLFIVIVIIGYILFFLNLDAPSIPQK